MIRSIALCASLLVCFTGVLTAGPENPAVTKPVSAGPGEKSIVLFDFEKPGIMKDRNVTFGTWELHPSYTAEISVVRPADAKECAARGAVLMIDYDVSVPEKSLPSTTFPVFNGVWFKLNDMDISKYDTVVLMLKGDAKKGHTAICKLELKNNFKETGSCYIEDIGRQWRKYEIPITHFRTADGKPIANRTAMKELTIVFEKNHVSKMQGVIYADGIGFARLKEGGKRAQPGKEKTAAAPAKNPKGSGNKSLIPKLW
jgi:hypothetical protein